MSESAVVESMLAPSGSQRPKSESSFVLASCNDSTDK